MADLAKVKATAEHVGTSRSAFREAVLAAHQDGANLREIAEAAGLSFQRVWQIVQEEKQHG